VTSAPPRAGGDLPRGIGKPATRALNGAGYHTLEHLTGARRADLARLHGVGPKALAVLDEAMRASGLAFLDAG
jgi:hypothetical protein